MENNLFICKFASGISYADKSKKKHGDFLSCAFLDFKTLTLSFRKECPKELIERIKNHAATIQAMKGEKYPISLCNQYVTLGS
jgi:hypothetical protein